MPRTIKDCLAQKKQGLTYGNRLILPFHCKFVSITIGLGMSMISTPTTYFDFSTSEKDVQIIEDDESTSVYFSDQDNLAEAFGKYKGGVTLTCCEKSDSFFDLSKHIKIQLRFRDDSPWVTIDQLT